MFYTAPICREETRYVMNSLSLPSILPAAALERHGFLVTNLLAIGGPAADGALILNPLFEKSNNDEGNDNE